MVSYIILYKAPHNSPWIHCILLVTGSDDTAVDWQISGIIAPLLANKNRPPVKLYTPHTHSSGVPNSIPLLLGDYIHIHHHRIIVRPPTHQPSIHIIVCPIKYTLCPYPHHHKGLPSKNQLKMSLNVKYPLLQIKNNFQYNSSLSTYLRQIPQNARLLLQLRIDPPIIIRQPLRLLHLIPELSILNKRQNNK